MVQMMVSLQDDCQYKRLDMAPYLTRAFVFSPSSLSMVVSQGENYPATCSHKVTRPKMALALAQHGSWLELMSQIHKQDRNLKSWKGFKHFRF